MQLSSIAEEKAVDTNVAELLVPSSAVAATTLKASRASLSAKRPSLSIDDGLKPEAMAPSSKRLKSSKTPYTEYKTPLAERIWNNKLRQLHKAKEDAISGDPAVAHRGQKKLLELEEYDRLLAEKAAGRAEAKARNDQKRLEANAPQRKARTLKTALWRERKAEEAGLDAIVRSPDSRANSIASESVIKANTDVTTHPSAH